MPGLSIEFFDSPSRLGNVSQFLALPPGRYTLLTELSASGLEAPRGLYWQISCPSVTLARLDLPDGSYENRSLEVDFSVPADCGTQTLTLMTDVKTDSWRDQYRGRLTISRTALRRQPVEAV